MNRYLNNVLEITGEEEALDMVKKLLDCGYQVFIQHDDFDVYVVSYEFNDDEMGTPKFVALTEAELEDLGAYRGRMELKRAKRLIEEADIEENI